MPWNGSGTPLRVRNWQNDQAQGILIRADLHDSEDDNLTAMIGDCLNRNGENSPTAAISWGDQRITNLGAGTGSGDAVNKGQMDTADAALQTAINAAETTLSVSANDSTPGLLSAKLTAGDGVVLAEQNDGANENLLVTAVWDTLSGKPTVIPQAEAEAGMAATERTITAQRLAQAIAALGVQPQWSLLTSLDTSSGTSVETLAIPAGTTAIRVVPDGVSLDGANDVLLEIGDVTSYSTSSVGRAMRSSAAGNANAAWAGTGPAELTEFSGAPTLYGEAFLSKHDNDTWTLTSTCADTGGGGRTHTSAGQIVLGGEMTRLRISASAGNLNGGAAHIWVYS